MDFSVGYSSFHQAVFHCQNPNWGPCCTNRVSCTNELAPNLHSQSADTRSWWWFSPSVSNHIPTRLAFLATESHFSQHSHSDDTKMSFQSQPTLQRWHQTVIKWKMAQALESHESAYVTRLIYCALSKVWPPSKIQAGDGHPLQFHKCCQQRIHFQRVTPV